MTARVLGLLHLAGALLIFLGLLLPHPEGANARALFALGGVALAVGAASLIWAAHARVWSVHAALATGTGVISLCLYFTDVAAGIYPVMFIWIILVAGIFFGPRAIAAHVGWVVISWGTVLLFIADQSGFPVFTRWTLGSLVLAGAAVVMSEIVAGRKSTEEQLRRAQDGLKALAHHDPLTGVANMRLFDLALDREIARATDLDSPLCLIVIDIDDFKGYNDEHGHVAGDRLLKSATSAWAATVRGSDMIARVGGDEFAVLLPECPSDEAEQVTWKLRASFPGGRSCSTGIACWDGQESAADFRERADLRMYEAKDRLRLTSA